MPSCKRCDKKFHACSSCGLGNDYEYYYCSDKCWEESEEYSGHAKRVNKILDSLPRDHWEILRDVMGDDDIYFIFEKTYQARQESFTNNPNDIA